MWVITYKETVDGPLLHHGPVAGSPFDAHDHLIAAYTTAGFSAPGHILMFKHTGDEGE